MEQHPLPQNITGFQFRLIGSMTLKQFGYLAGGSLLAYLSFFLFSFLGIFKWVVTFFFAFSGIAFAFLPIQDRPLDRWLICFLKSLILPPQFVWRKIPQVPEILSTSFGPQKLSPQKILPQFSESRVKLDNYLARLPQKPHELLDSFEKNYLQMISTLAVLPQPPSPLSSPKTSLPGRAPFIFPRITEITVEEEKLQEERKSAPPSPPPSPPSQPPPQEQEAEIKRLNAELENLRRQRPSPQATISEIKSYREKLANLERQLARAEQEKEILTTKMLKLAQQLEEKGQAKVFPQKVLEKKEEDGVRIIPPQLAKGVGLTNLSYLPNIISGIIQDQEGKFLPNMIVEVKDKKGLPVRAFKTNSLGQFFAATPLASGIYTLELEDPQNNYRFDIIEVKLTGEVAPPILVYAKTKKDLERKRLHQSLFGKKPD